MVWHIDWSTLRYITRDQYSKMQEDIPYGVESVDILGNYYIGQSFSKGTIIDILYIMSPTPRGLCYVMLTLCSRPL